MDFYKLQEGFGKDPAKLYVFDGQIPGDKDPVEYITHQFAEAAGTNLISCVVSDIGDTWMVYTKDTHELTADFRLVAEFPLPEPEPVEIPEPTPQEETPPKQGQ